MSDPRFELLAIEDVIVDGPCVLSSRELMSPYVWRQSGRLGLLLRAVPKDETPTGLIWYGSGDDTSDDASDGGLRFTTTDTPVIAPGLAHLDAGGCEDPTVIETDEGLVVFYTGVDGGGAAEMLWASGADPTALAKRGIAYHCSRTEKNTKEASVLRRQDGAWCAFYEYSHDGRSLVGFAIGETPSGPWEEHSDPLLPRAGHWDGHHLSTGPLIQDGDELLMFYNGATEDARWAIGWAVFDTNDMRLVDRCDRPIIVPSPDGADGREIAFANSLLVEGDLVRLYYSHDDKAPRRATLRRR